MTRIRGWHVPCTMKSGHARQPIEMTSCTLNERSPFIAFPTQMCSRDTILSPCNIIREPIQRMEAASYLFILLQDESKTEAALPADVPRVHQCERRERDSASDRVRARFELCQCNRSLRHAATEREPFDSWLAVPACCPRRRTRKTWLGTNGEGGYCGY